MDMSVPLNATGCGFNLEIKYFTSCSRLQYMNCLIINFLTKCGGNSIILKKDEWELNPSCSQVDTVSLRHVDIINISNKEK